MKYKVYLLTTYCEFNDIEANDEDEAIKKCGTPPELDLNEPFQFIAVEEEEDE